MMTRDRLPPASRRPAAQARPARHGPQPGDVRRRARRAADDHPGIVGERGAARLVRVHRRRLAVADGPVRQLRRGDRRGPRQGAGRRRCAPCARTPSRALRDGPTKPAADLARGDVVVVEAGEAIPGDGTVDRGHRVRRRVRHHRRVGAGHPRVRRRPQRGHRRHARALRPDRRRDHPGARAVVPRPDDRAGRGRRAAQDAERDRALDPARRAHARLPRRRRDAAAVRRVRRHRRLDHHRSSRCSSR